jgi:hypothetical protein
MCTGPNTGAGKQRRAADGAESNIPYKTPVLNSLQIAAKRRVQSFPWLND